MSLIKCPRCELNYMLDTEKMCSVCRREVRGESEQDDMIELCSECGENPVVPGQELCAYCLKELAQRTTDTAAEDGTVSETTNIGIDSVSTMDEIELDINDDDIADDEFESEDADEVFDDEETEEEEPQDGEANEAAVKSEKKAGKAQGRASSDEKD